MNKVLIAGLVCVTSLYAASAIAQDSPAPTPSNKTQTTGTQSPMKKSGKQATSKKRMNSHDAGVSNTHNDTGGGSDAGG